ncbi:MAG: ATP-dependent 6-phosphofructokinase [Dehalococcoidia bacterium]|nr:ATP-dependent 6-phosphofructokinase [Dehalococcoidia bacterium]
MNNCRIGVLTGGGDCAGLNPALKWVTKAALDSRFQATRTVTCGVVGIRDGWKGLIEVEPGTPEEANWLQPLDESVVRTWDRFGGTNLGTSRTNPFDPKKDRSKKVMENIEKLGIDVLIVIGGDDTLGVAHRLAQMGVKVVGVPKTIDNDLSATDYSLGFETAVDVITEEIDRLRTTAGSHKRIFVVETMGRYTGWLSLAGGESSGAYIIIVPECPFSIAKINSLLLDGKKRGLRYEIVVVAEGAKPEGGQEIVQRGGTDAFGHKALGGVGQFLADQIAEGTGLDTRSVTLSHLQRGGAPCAYDRRMGRYFGIAAVDMVVRGEFGRMVSYRNGRITSVDLKEAIGKQHRVDIENDYDVERYNGKRTILGYR